MSIVAEVARWLADPAHWGGSDGIPTRVAEHVALSAAATGVAVVLALPLGVYLGHARRFDFGAINIGNIGRALPSLALLAFALPVSFALGLGLGFWPTLFAMVPLGIPPILTNSVTAVREVDRDVVDAARGMGMSGWELMRLVEIPIAAPLIIAGVRNAAVAIVATATLGAVVAGGGLGRYLVDGLARQEYARLVAGAMLVALLAIATELVFGLFERLVVSAGVRRELSLAATLQ